MSSVPLKKRQVFDGVEVLTFQAIARRRAVQRAGTTKDIIHTGQDLVSIPPTPSSRRARTKRAMQSTLPSSIGSDEDDLDWEDFCIDGTSSGKHNFCIGLDIRLPRPLFSEADIDRSLAHAQPSSPPGTQTSALHGTPVNTVVRLTSLNETIRPQRSSFWIESAKGEVPGRKLSILTKGRDYLKARRPAGCLFLRCEWCVTDTLVRTCAGDKARPPNWRGVDRANEQENEGSQMTFCSPSFKL